MIFAQNLDLLRQRSPELAAALEAETGEGVELGVGPSGVPTITESGLLLASAYAPETEGLRMAEEMDRADPDLMIALGFGLGHHLEAFRARNRCPLVVFEPSRARLRAALGARSQREILSRSDVYLVEDMGDLHAFVSHLYTSGLRMGVFPLPSLLRLAPKTIREAVDRIAQAKSAADIAVHTRVQMLVQWATITAGNGRSLRDTPSLSRLHGAFSGRTAVVACAGPSLTKQLPALKRVRDRVLLLSIGQAVGALREAGLEPDLVHVLESLPVVHQLEKGGSSESLNLVVTPDVDPSLFECPVATRFVGTPESNKLARWLYEVLGDDQFLIGGGSVAHGTVAIAAALGARRIVLLGQDLAFTDGEAYARGSAYAETGFELCEDGRFRWKNVEAKHAQFASLNWELRNPAQQTFWVEGWKGDKVPTSRAYASFIDQYTSMAASLERAGVTLVNCTEGGARIPKVLHEPFAAIEADLGEAFDARRTLQDRLKGWSAPKPDVFDSRIEEARQALDALETDARRAAGEAERRLEELAREPAPGRVIQLLKRTKKRQAAISKALDAIPWLDDVLQPELQATHADLCRTYGDEQTPARAIESSLAQLRSVEVGVERARGLLERLAGSLAS